MNGELDFREDGQFIIDDLKKAWGAGAGVANFAINWFSKEIDVRMERIKNACASEALSEELSERKDRQDERTLALFQLMRTIHEFFKWYDSTRNNWKFAVFQKASIKTYRGRK